MAYNYQNQGGYNPSNAQNLQFYSSGYGQQPVSGHSTPFQAYSGGSQSNAYSSSGFGGGFGGQAGVSGRMGEQGGLRTGWLAAFGTEGYDGEPPLLEELGVNFDHIKMKTLTVLNPTARIDQHLMDDSDLAGPILFAMLFGFFLALSGKANFGFVYGLAAFGSITLHTIFSLMAPPTEPSQQNVASPPSAHGHTSSHFNSSLTFFRSTSVLGYCLLPLVLTSLVGVFVPMNTFSGFIFVSFATIWCTYSSSAMFCAVGRMSEMRWLVAYPLGLFYLGFGIMSLFSSSRSPGMPPPSGSGSGRGP